jgi:hypothetical protein
MTVGRQPLLVLHWIDCSLLNSGYLISDEGDEETLPTTAQREENLSAAAEIWSQVEGLKTYSAGRPVNGH